MKKALFPIMVFTILTASISVISAQTLQTPEAQPPVDVSDQELATFSAAYASVQKMQQGLNEEINDLVAESDLGQKKFQEIYQSHLTDNQEELSELSPGEQESFTVLMDDIAEVQNGQQEKMVAAIRGEGLTVERFNTVAAAIKEDPSLYKKFMDIAQN